ncbi:HAMP domain-containing histidine kinase [bacterium]|nr:HAMP domain-containing histidine kinase [bacterium]
MQRLNAVIDSPDLFFYGYAYYRYADQRTEEVRPTPELERYNYDKFRARNGFSNCFISRRFNSFYRVPVENGYLQLYYTTPPEVVGLSRLVVTFWAIAALFMAAVALAAGLVQRSLLRPLLNVSTHLDMPFGAAEAVIPPGGSLLEESYNRLAINAYRADLSARLSSLLSEAESSRGDHEAGTAAALGFLLRETGAGQGALYMLERSSGQLVRSVERHEGDAFLPAVLPRLALDLAGRPVRSEELCPGDAGVPTGRPVLLLPLSAETGDGAALVLAWNDPNAARRLDPRFYGAIAQALDNFLLRARHREMLLEREKTAVGIHLATNMGHDLTNVIATARWDLATLEKARERGLLTFDPHRGAAAQSALDGLIHTFRLLQELVELYRAYGYAERPTMAPLDLGELAENVCDLFRRSTSRRVCLELARETPASPYIGEARLLSLALYNLLSNAVDSVLAGGTAEPRVQVRVAGDGRDGWRISVSDNGPGVRDPSGRLLEAWEMKTIFSRGYSTKSAGGTGLGLSWVKQIVEEVHGGRLQMENLPDGGARASLVLPAPPPPPAPG